MILGLWRLESIERTHSFDMFLFFYFAFVFFYKQRFGPDPLYSFIHLYLLAMSSSRLSRVKPGSGRIVVSSHANRAIIASLSCAYPLKLLSSPVLGSSAGVGVGAVESG